LSRGKSKDKKIGKRLMKWACIALLITDIEEALDNQGEA